MKHSKTLHNTHRSLNKCPAVVTLWMSQCVPSSEPRQLPVCLRGKANANANLDPINNFFNDSSTLEDATVQKM